MKSVDLYVTGNYDNRTCRGIWVFYLEYHGAVMKRSGYIENAQSFTRVSLYAIIQALNHINESCMIHIHSKVNLGFKDIKRSRNTDFISEIQHTFVRMGHMFTFDRNFDDEKINRWENTYSNKKSNKDNKTDNKRPDKNKNKDYDKMIEEQALQSKDWREMYSDLMSESHGAWVPGSGGY